MPRRNALRSGFTVTELLVVISLIVVLLGLLLPALSGVWSSGEMTRSMSSMRQIGMWMREYSSANNETVLPSRFDHATHATPGKVRSYPSPATGTQYAGSWADILWAQFNLGTSPESGSDNGHDYRYAAPDRFLYDLVGEDGVSNPLRSATPNTWNAPVSGGTPGARPYGDGAQQQGYPGFFAANDFFRSDDPAGIAYYSMGQIKRDAQSMYLVDSFYGATIPATAAAYDTSDGDGDGVPDSGEVDFRYAGINCLMLFLDGHVDPQGIWLTIDDLEGNPSDPTNHGRNVRVRNLTN